MVNSEIATAPQQPGPAPDQAWEDPDASGGDGPQAVAPAERQQGGTFPTYAGDDVYKRVALAVLLQAVKDADGPPDRAKTHAARRWLSGRQERKDLVFWCDILGWDWRYCVNNCCRRWYEGEGCIEIGAVRSIAEASKRIVR